KPKGVPAGRQAATRLLRSLTFGSQLAEVWSAHTQPSPKSDQAGSIPRKPKSSKISISELGTGDGPGISPSLKPAPTERPEPAPTLTEIAPTVPASVLLISTPPALKEGRSSPMARP